MGVYFFSPGDFSTAKGSNGSSGVSGGNLSSAQGGKGKEEENKLLFQRLLRQPCLSPKKKIVQTCVHRSIGICVCGESKP